jgi:hypothetical protein
MDDLLVMCVLDRVEHLQKQLQAGADPETVRVTPFSQWAAFNVLHRQVRQPVRIHSRIVQTRDVRMFEAREDVALSGKALLEIPTQATQHRQLQRHIPPEGTIGTPREPHFGHAARPEKPDQLVWSDACAGLQAAGRGRARLDCGLKVRQRLELLDLCELGVPGQQRVAQRLREVLVLSRQRLEPGTAPGRIEWQCLIEETAHPPHLRNR